MRRVCLIGLICIAASSGCAVTEAGKDQDNLRAALLDLYTNQIMDNLIRAKTDMPIIHLDYINATSNVTMKNNAGLNNNLQTTATSVATSAATAVTVGTRQTLNIVTGSLGLDHTNQVGITASPVQADDAVYDAYAAFLEIPGSLEVTCDPPGKCAAHICKRCGKLYYWVPVGYEREFLRLALATTAQRAQPLPALDAFYAVNIVDVISYTPVANYWKIEVKIDKKIPNDTGRIEISSTASGGAKTPATAGSATAAKAGAPAPAANSQQPAAGSQPTVLRIELNPGNDPTTNKRWKQTDHLFLEFIPPAPSAAKAGDPPAKQDPDANLTAFLQTLQKLQGGPVSAKAYLRNHHPHQRTPNDPINRIEFQLQQIQYNQLQLQKR